jgi:5-formyltetrahydrofolate cyclo-ligase
MKIVLLEHIAERGRRLLEEPDDRSGIQELVRSLQEIKQTSWKVIIEPLILFDQSCGKIPRELIPDGL